VLLKLRVSSLAVCGPQPGNKWRHASTGTGLYIRTRCACACTTTLQPIVVVRRDWQHRSLWCQQCYETRCDFQRDPPSPSSAVLFCSSAVPDPRVGHTMDVISSFISVPCHSDWLFHGESCPRLDVVHLGRARSSSPACTWHCSLHNLFLQATPLFLYGVTIVG